MNVLLYVQEVVTHFVVSYYVKWVTTAFRGALFFFNFCGEEA